MPAPSIPAPRLRRLGATVLVGALLGPAAAALPLVGDLALAGPPAPAHAAAPPATCMLRVVNAQPGPPGIDPALARLRPHLQRPPFTAWKSFKLMTQKQQVLAPGTSASYELPNGKTATVTYTSHALGRRGRHVIKGVFQVAGPDSSARTGFALDEGGYFLVAGDHYQKGILIYSLSCRAD